MRSGPRRVIGWARAQASRGLQAGSQEEETEARLARGASRRRAPSSCKPRFRRRRMFCTASPSRTFICSWTSGARAAAVGSSRDRCRVTVLLLLLPAPVFFSVFIFAEWPRALARMPEAQHFHLLFVDRVVEQVAGAAKVHEANAALWRSTRSQRADKRRVAQQRVRAAQVVLEPLRI